MGLPIRATPLKEMFHSRAFVRTHSPRRVGLLFSGDASAADVGNKKESIDVMNKIKRQCSRLVLLQVTLVMACCRTVGVFNHRWCVGAVRGVLK